MVRIAFCLLVALASADLAAREVKMSSPNDSCPTAAAEGKATDRAAERKRAAAPQQETRVRPTEHSDAPGGGGRLHSPRWHSFLPGMVR